MNNCNRPETTLFLLMSADGKITSGSTDALDPDKDWKTLPGVKEGLQQYYDIEQTTDLWSLNTGRTIAKTGINEKKNFPLKGPVSFVLIDRKPHLTENGLTYLSNWLNKIVIVTNNKNHPAIKLSTTIPNMAVMFFEGAIDLHVLFQKLKADYQVERVTIQSGGTMNAQFFSQGLIDKIRIVVAPLIVGGKDTPTLVDGESIKKIEELGKLKSLKLRNCRVLADSFIDLEYDVNNKTSESG
jgi:2,5-diamino-6-(ribosylamino)-4(3H)-pyrimidinone 5'-phosphate reductase